MFSRNAASSRAIPIKKMIRLVLDNPAVPLQFGSNKAGMQSGPPLEGRPLLLAKAGWWLGRHAAVLAVRLLDSLGVHKEITNRILEPFSHIKVVMTTTELNNFYWLRDHPDAQPEIRYLAQCMKVSMDDFYPLQIGRGEWHVPYVDRNRDYETGRLVYSINGVELSPDDAIKVSASCCAQVSYRTLDGSIDKALKIYAMLIESEPQHASPVEHQASPKGYTSQGMTHRDKNKVWWSGNFREWIQFRQTL
jgi:hypothetical protein